MPLYKVEINKRREEYHWRNTYHVGAPTMVEVVAAIPVIADCERNIHLNNVYFVDGTVNAVPTLGLPPTVVPLNFFGTRISIGQALKPENVVRVQWQTDEYPGEKEYRYVLTEQDVQDYVIAETVAGEIEIALAALATDLPEGAELVTSSENTFGVLTVDRYVQNKQLHRKRRRITPPT